MKQYISEKLKFCYILYNKNIFVIYMYILKIIS